MKLYVATGNDGKLREIKKMLSLYMPFIDEVEGRAPKNAEETESTFLGNAEIKSMALYQELRTEGKKNFWVLADDSGLEIEVLENRPGVHSARYAGDHVDPELHMKKVLTELRAFPMLEQRKARYVCALSVLDVNHSLLTRKESSEGYCYGMISQEQRGNSGFGYDPIFWVPEHQCHMAELDELIKNNISHRKKAFEKLGRVFLE